MSKNIVKLKLFTIVKIYQKILIIDKSRSTLYELSCTFGLVLT